MGADGRRALRVLAADDSAVMRGVIRTVFRLHAEDEDSRLPRMELCGVVRDGVEALEAVRVLAPDVLLLDLEMPRMDGLAVLEELRRLAPALPVIMCSAHTVRGARSTLDALAQGAKDYVMKPGQQSDFASALDLLMQQLLPKIAALAGEETSRGAAWHVKRESVPLAGVDRRGDAADAVEIVVIGVSTGGPSALELMLPLLPRDFAVPVMIVQHMPKLFTGALAERLDRLCELRVREATDGAAVKPGTVWLAPGDAHMEVVQGLGGRSAEVRLHQNVPLNSCRPSVDYLFHSAAAMYGAATLALVMTGMGSDGLNGARTVRAAGGTVLAQDERSSAVWGMPARVARAGLTAGVIPLSGLAAALIQRVQSGRGERSSGAAEGSHEARTRRSEGRLEVMHGLL